MRASCPAKQWIPLSGPRKRRLPPRILPCLVCGKPCSATLTKHDGARTLAMVAAGRDLQYAAALTLAFAGDTGRARALSDDLAKRFRKTPSRGSTTCRPSTQSLRSVGEMLLRPLRVFGSPRRMS